MPLRDVQAELRRAGRLKPPAVRGAAEVGLSLQIIAGSIDWRRRAATRPPAGNPPAGLCAELLRAARSPRLAARAAWEALSARAEELLASGGEGYWTEALTALRVALREMPREAVRQIGADLRARMAPRPPSMPRLRYRRSLQLQLLSASSERAGVPPRAFLL